MALGTLAALLILSFFLYWRTAGRLPNTSTAIRWMVDKKGSGNFYRVSPDGKWLLGTGNNGSANIVLYDPNSGEIRPLTPERSRKAEDEFDAFAIETFPISFELDGNVHDLGH